MPEFKELADLCRGHKVYIQTHNFPDADAVASAYGLKKLLEHFDIESTLCCAGDIDRVSTLRMVEMFDIHMMTQGELTGVMTETDYIICVDSQKNSGNITDFIGDEVACIDHHPIYAEADYRYDERVITGACSTLIARHYETLGITPDTDVATALLYGIKMDTLQFSRGVTLIDVDAFRFLLSLADGERLRRLEQNSLVFSDLCAYGAAIENIVVYDTVGFAHIPFACPDGLIGALSDFLLALDEVEVAIVYSMRENGIKFSVRSEISEVHAGDLIHRALSGVGNGGGHASMAGGFIPGADSLGAHPDFFIRERFMAVLGERDGSSR